MKFEIINAADAPQRPTAARGRVAGLPDQIEEWCASIAAVECHKAGKAAPVVKYRYSQTTNGRYAWEAVYSDTFAADLRARYGANYREQMRASYCETHQDDDMCQPDRYVRFQTARPKNASQYSSGRTYGVPYYGHDIVVTFGTNDTDRKLVFLHELAHYLCPASEYHGRVFWKRAFDLYDKYGIPKEWYLPREQRYRKMAGKVAARTGRRLEGDES